MTTRSTLHIGPEIQLAIDEAGESGRPVLVLHGGGGPATVAPIVEHFAPRHRVLAPVHPGWEDTTRPERLGSVADLAQTYLDLLDARGLRDVLVLGSSFGGWVAAEMAVRDRDGVLGDGVLGDLVLLDAIGAEIPGHEISLPTPAPGRPGPPSAAIEAIRTYGGAAMADPGLLQRLAQVRTRALVVWGEDDQVISAGYGREYAAAFPDARFETIPGAGHLPQVQAPAATFTVIDEFLSARS
ncbi:alpha/beta hydrolase [Saccharopolyspora sp. NPDC047091]|uniref:alpha/beta fold hydrolase n=1 Tax=Saccharopolyspora sp. NPDC047091 TaxID=3155924 RepID=UPI0033CCD758